MDHGETGEFLTLTYDNDHLQNRSYRDVQLFLKKLRYLQKLRFFVAPDLGRRTKRFHWHMLLYHQNPDTTALHNAIQKSWVSGISDTRPILRERIGYTCGYVTQKITQVFTDRPHMSQSLGTAYYVAKGRQLATEGRPLNNYPNLLKIGKSRYPIDATCKRYLKKGFEDAGGVIGSMLDTPGSITEIDRVEKHLRYQSFGGNRGELIHNRHHHGKNQNFTKTKTQRYYPPSNPPLDP